MKKTAILTLAFLIVLTLNVTAIGVTPALTILDYKPGEIYTIKFTVTNTENKTIEAAIMPEWEAEAKVIELNPLESRELAYVTKMPSNMEPGMQNMNIIIQELPGEPIPGAQITATAAVITRVQFRVPYDGKAIEADVSMTPMTQSKMGFTITVTNLGSETIKDLNAEIKILNEDIKTESQELDPQKRTKLKAEWTAPAQGEYQAEITVNYDGKSRTITANFDAGSESASYYKIDSEKTPKNEKMTIILALILTIALTANIYFYVRHRKKKSPS